jgi:hypothetical protein
VPNFDTKEPTNIWLDVKGGTNNFYFLLNYLNSGNPYTARQGYLMEETSETWTPYGTDLMSDFRL